MVEEMGKRDLGDLIFWTGIFYYYAFIITFFIAIPAFAVFRYFGIVRWWSTSLMVLCSAALTADVSATGRLASRFAQSR